MSEIEKVLLAATKAKAQRPNEDRQKYLLRLMLAVTKLPEEGWNALEATAGVQEWHTAAVDADNAKKAVPDFSDAEEDVEEDAEAADDAAEEGVEEDNDQEDEVKTQKKTAKAEAPAKPAAKSGAKPAVKAAAKPTAKAAPAAGKAKPEKKAAAPAKKAAGAKAISPRRALKMIVVKKPKTTVDELIEKLKEKGFDKLSRLTVTSIRSDTRDTIKVLNEAGLTSIEL